MRFSPTAWAKLLFLRDLGETEIGGFGITAADDLLRVQDVVLVRQVCTGVSVCFDDQAVADFFDQQVDSGRRPECFGRVWVHTHPGNSPEPSLTDEETFARVFGSTHWAVMFVSARGGRCYARLRFNVGPGGEMELPVSVDYSQPFAASDHAAWEAECLATVEMEEPPAFTLSRLEPQPSRAAPIDPWDEDWFLAWGRPSREQQAGFVERKEPAHAG